MDCGTRLHVGPRTPLAGAGGVLQRDAPWRLRAFSSSHGTVRPLVLHPPFSFRMMALVRARVRARGRARGERFWGGHCRTWAARNRGRISGEGVSKRPEGVSWDGSELTNVRRAEVR